MFKKVIRNLLLAFLAGSLFWVMLPESVRSQAILVPSYINELAPTDFDWGGYNSTNATYVNATYFVGDGSGLTGIGATNSTALSFTVKADENLKKGQAVYIVNGTSSLPNVRLANCTTTGSSRVVGIITTNVNANANGLVRRAGELTLVDTRTSNTAVNPNGETWVEGDLLFLSSTPGGLTKNRPTSGRTVKVAYSLKGSSATDSLLAYPMENPVWVTAASNENITLRLGDSAGATNVTISNYTNTSKATIDSLGNATFANVVATQFFGNILWTNVTSVPANTTSNQATNTTSDVVFANVNATAVRLPSQTKAFTVINANETSNWTLWQTPKAITIKDISVLVQNGTNVTVMLYACNATGTGGCVPCNATAWVCSNQTEMAVTSFENTTVGAGNWTRWVVSGINGGPLTYGATIKYDEN